MTGSTSAARCAGMLEGRRVVVLGGSRGIGLATAQLVVRQGAEIVVTGRNARALPSSAGVLAGAWVEELDLADGGGIERFFAGIGALNHVVLSGAPHTFDCGLAEIGGAAARRHVEARFWSAVHVARCAIPNMPETGSLTYVIGALSRRPMPGRAMTTAAQAAVEGLVRGLALDAAPRRVNAVRAGLTDTLMWDHLPAPERAAFYDAYATRVPARRVGQAEDVAQMILAAMENPNVTGATLAADGGALLA